MERNNRKENPINMKNANDAEKTGRLQKGEA